MEAACFEEAVSQEIVFASRKCFSLKFKEPCHDNEGSPSSHTSEIGDLTLGVGSCLGYCNMLKQYPDLYPLNASNISSPPGCDNQKCRLRHKTAPC